MSDNSMSPAAKDVPTVSVIPFPVSCHDQPLEVHNTGTFRSSTGREVKMLLKCPVCQQWWPVQTGGRPGVSRSGDWAWPVILTPVSS